MQQAVETVTSFKEDEARLLAADVDATPSADKALDLLVQHSITGDVEEAEIAAAHMSLKHFGKRYLPRYFTSPFSDKLHTPLFKALRRAATHRTHTPTVIIAWPESGKSTCAATLLPLHNIACGNKVTLASGHVIDQTKRYIMFTSASQPQAKDNLQSVTEQLELNDMLRRDSGDLVGRKPWADYTAVTKNGIYMRAVSRQTRIRSTRRGEVRPDLGIDDDIDDKVAGAQAARAGAIDWFLTTHLSRFDSLRGNVILIGNVPHEFSIIAQVYVYGLEHGWDVHKFSLYTVDDAGNKIYTWPERCDAAWEARKREELMGRDAPFEVEFQQNPSGGFAELSLEDITKWYYDFVDIESSLPTMELYIAIDPAASLEKRADYTAVVPIAYDHKTQTVYVLEPFHEHVGIEAQAAALAERWFHYRACPLIRMGVEAVGYQTALAPYVESHLAKLGLTTHVYPIHQTRQHKFGRIRRLFSAIKNGRIVFIRGCDAHMVMIDTLLTISRGAEPDHDDLADALEMVVRLKDDEYFEDLERSGGVDVDVSVTKIPKALLTSPVNQSTYIDGDVVNEYIDGLVDVEIG